MAIATLAYLAAFFPLYRTVGPATAALAIVPVAIVGCLFGLRPGVAAGVLGALVDGALFTLTTTEPSENLRSMFPAALAFAFGGGMAGHLRDLGQRVRRQAAALERELGQRREYTDVLAHELRNPLVAIRAAARTREHGPRQLALIAEEAARALELLDSLNDASSIEAGRMRSVLSPTDLVATVRSVVDASHELTGRIRLQVPPSPVVVNGDEDRLGQVVRNLISNAAKYAPGGLPVEVNVGVSADRRRGVVQVRDYGPGIAPAERPRLFERFARLSTAGDTSGSGLGLYICRGIIRDHDGLLDAEWPSGGGSLFAFEIPLADRS